MRIFKSFQIEAAHFLPHVPDGHKCKRLHGHSFRVEIHVEGDVGEQSGWVTDFAEIGRVFAPVFTALDHHCLNDIEGLENPTSENLAAWIWQRIADNLPGLTKLAVLETPSSGCEYFGPGQE